MQIVKHIKSFNRVYDVQLLDDGTLDTVMSVNGKEYRFNYDCNFTNKEGEIELNKFRHLANMAIEAYEEDKEKEHDNNLAKLARGFSRMGISEYE